MNELPEEACIREAQEEAGLKINPEHYHIDFVFIDIRVRTIKLVEDIDKSNKLVKLISI